eukprot:14570629-Ditylum_brightwellii.AAC.1
MGFPCRDNQQSGFSPPSGPSAPHIHSYPHNTSSTPLSHDRSIQSISADLNENIVDRIVRPGIMGSSAAYAAGSGHGHRRGGSNGSNSWTRNNNIEVDSLPSALPQLEPPATTFIIDDFDYNKYSPDQIQSIESGASISQTQTMGEHRYHLGVVQNNIVVANGVQNFPPVSHQPDHIDDVLVDRGSEDDDSCNISYTRKKEDISNETYHDYGARDLEHGGIDDTYSAPENLFARQQDERMS